MDRSKFALAVGVGIAVLVLSRKGNAMAPRKTEMQLSPHFKLSEFLRSRAVPEVSYYKPNEQEIANLRFLVVNVLEPLRSETGPIFISGGMRPNLVNKAGETFDEALTREGYTPARESDHKTFNGVDIQFPGKSKAIYLKAYELLKRNPNVRQVIIYLETDPATGVTYADHIHVSSVAPGLPRFADSGKFAFLNLDGRKAASNEAIV